jgi:hypothetical protein
MFDQDLGLFERIEDLPIEQLVSQAKVVSMASSTIFEAVLRPTLQAVTI